MVSSVANIRKRSVFGKDAHTYYPVLIIGAGESGIATGCRLKEVLGFDQFRIFDRQSGIGGTWWINRYPGVACDIPAILYSFSFAPKKNWTTLHPPGSEITQYLADVCEKYRIVDKIQLNTDINELRWIEDAEEWEVTLTHLVPGTGDLSKLERDSLVARKGRHSVYVKTEVVRAKIVVSGVGGIVEPKTWPEDIPGIETFEGEILHTARWNSDIDLQGKDVVVIGAGCSAAQVIPELIKPEFNVKSVTQLMRTPPWVQPNLMEPSELRLWEKYSPMLFSNIPGAARIARSVLFFMLELSFFRMFKNGGIFNRLRSSTEKLFLDNMRCLAPAKYHEILTPNYSLGCKRRIIDNDWYVSLQASNVELTTLALTRIQPKSVVIGPRRHYAPGSIAEVGEVKEVQADTIILANGYQTNRWFHSLQVIGRNGKDLEDVWNERGGAQAYLGIAMDQFPNFFMVFGPNTATGHTSVIFASENAVNYSLNFMKPILDGHVSTYEVTEEAERNWTDKVQKALQNTVFQRGACTSWYQTKDGWNSSTYP
ncbi:monooxygenase [Aspergillus sclerotialis]|uniref:Monooxygenase n=1 Tax=Aspergillus sclerotialis TaxID=2070753 RepID=A0A3A2ZR91_9EURO|nr:monooxygenase [Aspergillus sclerotialis]